MSLNIIQPFYKDSEYLSLPIIVQHSTISPLFICILFCIQLSLPFVSFDSFLKKKIPQFISLLPIYGRQGT